MNDYFKHIEKIAYSYDINIQLQNIGINQYEYLPERFFHDPSWNDLIQSEFNSNGKDIKEFLKPKEGQKYLDLGCYVNFINLQLYKWPSVYYGVDISPEVIKLLKGFSKKNGIPYGGFFRRSIDNLHFSNDFFQICTCINVFEYHSKEYVNKALNEIHRVMDMNSRFVCDIPNSEHQAFKLMLKIEKFLGRPNLFHYKRSSFEKIINNKFSIEKVNDKELMIRYYLKKNEF